MVAAAAEIATAAAVRVTAAIVTRLRTHGCWFASSSAPLAPRRRRAWSRRLRSHSGFSQPLARAPCPPSPPWASPCLACCRWQVSSLSSSLHLRARGGRARPLRRWRRAFSRRTRRPRVGRAPRAPARQHTAATCCSRLYSAAVPHRLRWLSWFSQPCVRQACARASCSRSSRRLSSHPHPESSMRRPPSHRPMLRTCRCGSRPFCRSRRAG